MPNPLSRWIRESPRGPGAGKGQARGSVDPSLKFKQTVERWVELKRLHLGFAQVLNSLLNGNSSPINLIKQSMLCAHELREFRAYAEPEPRDQKRLTLENLPGRLPLQSYEKLYSLINSGTLDDKSLECLIDKNNVHVAESILKVTADPVARLDNYFFALADEYKFDGADRTSKWTQEITVLHKTVMDLYMQVLKEKDLL